MEQTRNNEAKDKMNEEARNVTALYSVIERAFGMYSFISIINQPL